MLKSCSYAVFGLMLLGANFVLAQGLPATQLPATVEAAQLPEMAAITNTAEKKAVFFGFLHPIIEGMNLKVSSERAWLKLIENRMNAGKALELSQTALLNELRIYYKVKAEPGSDVFFSQMYQRVDTIPASLVLAQAANESAWGTSRFAVKGNNLFGQWCFSEGCGLVPQGRDSGANHEVRVFESVADSVAAYFRNLNTHYQYVQFREIRGSSRDDRVALNSTELVWGLKGYSSRGEDYIRELISMIEHNSLKNFDQSAFYAQNSVQLKRD